MRNVAVRAKPRLRVGSEASHDPRTLTRLTSCQYPRWYDITVHAVPKSLIWPYRLQAFPRSHLPPSAFESCKAASCEVEVHGWEVDFTLSLRQKLFHTYLPRYLTR